MPSYAANRRLIIGIQRICKPFKSLDLLSPTTMPSHIPASPIILRQLVAITLVWSMSIELESFFRTVVLIRRSNDNFQTIPANVATVADILEDKGIAWGAYQEDMPYSGFEGFSWVDPAQKNDYVRKHNPFIEYDSIADNKDRLAVIKNFTLFYEDLDNNKLPQYFFITPNMTNDGHDTNVTVAAKWARAFLTPLLTNKDFMQNTLVLLTFE